MVDAKAPRRHSDFCAQLSSWRPRSARQGELADDYVRFVTEHGASALERGGAEHLTASVFVFSEDLRRVLLCFHGKARFWVQVGGHIEARDAGVRDAAMREAREETGLTSIRPLRQLPVDLHRHRLSSSFGTCEVHRDVGFAAVADVREPLVVSAESETLGWFDVCDIPEPAPNDFAERLGTVRAELEASAL